MRAAVTAFAFGINVGKTKRGERDRRGLVFFGVKFVIPRHDLSSRRDAEAIHPNRQEAPADDPRIGASWPQVVTQIE